MSLETVLGQEYIKLKAKLRGAAQMIQSKAKASSDGEP
jgi:hypothetical protein